MTSDARIRTIVFEAVAEIAGRGVATIEPGQTLEQGLGIDSLDFVRLIQVIEERLDISLSDEQAAVVATVEDLVALSEATAASSKS